MKLKVIFLKKKHIYIAATILILILISIFFVTLKPKKNSLSTLNIMPKNKTLKADLNGDGEEDTLYIKTKNNRYSIEIKTKGNKILYLKPDKKLNSLGINSETWPIKIFLKDINRDNIDEIFIQSAQENKSIQHIFMWDKQNQCFKDILCNYNNLLGFADYSNNKTPKLISGNFNTDGKVYLNNYMLIGSNLRNFNETYSENFMGKAIIGDFISLILSNNEDPSEDFLKKLCFETSIPQIKNTLVQFNSKISKIEFEDGSFKDSSSNDKGDLTSINWTLNFKAQTKDTNKEQNYSFSIILKPCANNTESTDSNSKNNVCLKINSLSISSLNN